MRVRHAVPALALLLTVSATACVHGAGDDPAFTETDSAGVRIAESSAPNWPAGEGWALSGEPLVDIGEAEGEDAYRFGWIMTATFLPDGGLVVLDGQSAVLRAYDPDGTHRWSTGGQGGGPGEFSRPSAVVRLGTDSLLVWDPARPGASILTTDGAFVRSFLVDAGNAGFSTRSVAVTPDRTLLLFASGSTALLDGPPLKQGMARERDPVLRVDLGTGAVLDTVGVYPGMEWYATEGGIGPPPFAHMAWFALRDSTLVVGTSEDFSVDLYALDGRLAGIERVSGIDLAVRDGDMEAYRNAYAEVVDDPQQLERLMDRLDKVPVPERKAAYSMILADTEGNLWLLGVPVGPHLSREVSVISPQGRYLGTVTLPERFVPTDIRGDALVGYWRDELDVQHVRVYAILK